MGFMLGIEFICEYGCATLFIMLTILLCLCLGLRVRHRYFWIIHDL